MAKLVRRESCTRERTQTIRIRIRTKKGSPTRYKMHARYYYYCNPRVHATPLLLLLLLTISLVNTATSFLTLAPTTIKTNGRFQFSRAPEKTTRKNPEQFLSLDVSKNFQSMTSLKSESSSLTISQILDLQRNDETKSESEISWPAFAIVMTFGVPAFFVMLPLSIGYQIFKKFMMGDGDGDGSSTSSDAISAAKKEGVQEEEEFLGIIPLKERKYDLVLLGATGFTGSLAVEYLMKQYGVGKSVKWAIAGRNLKKINELKRSIAKKGNYDESTMDKIDVIIVDTSKRSTLPDLVRNTRTVASTAGPFYAYGSPVVEFCAKYGTSYADITGEVDWSQEMIFKYASVAEETGAQIVSFCGHDSVPWDLSAAQLSEVLKDGRDEELVSIDFVDKVEGGISGGTLATACLAMDRSGKGTKYDFDPFLRTKSGGKSSRKTKISNPIFPSSVSCGKFKGKWTAPFLMAGVNAAVVRRSNALLDEGSCEGSSKTYSEAMLAKDLKLAIVQTMILVLAVVSLINPFSGYLVKKIIPKPGEGPSERTMEKGYLLIAGVGKGSKGSIAESMLYFPNDAGYFYTSRMLIESALSLALDRPKLPIQEGGFYTPATALGSVLLERLKVIGMKFAVEIQDK